MWINMTENVENKKENIENLNEENLKNQGEKASEVFKGESNSLTIKQLYEESAEYFADIIKSKLSDKNKTYKLADLGSFKGELLGNILGKLHDYKFNTIAVDINEEALKENSFAQKKIIATLDKTTLKNKSVDIAICRYVLQWNNQQKQQEILKEISRITKGFAIIQHVGADNENSDKWRERIDDLLDGEEIPKLKRIGHHFSSRDEIENWMQENKINFERLTERKVENVSNVFIERYNLNDEESLKTKEILGDKNYIIQTTWLIKG
jgi:ubiquinone/menaquinone biosynthesis C-methylase UbiE